MGDEIAKGLCFELGGSHAVVAVVAGRQVLISEELPIAHGTRLESILPTLSEVAKELLLQSGVLCSDLLGLAISLASIIDSETNRVVATNDKYPDAQSLDLVQWGQEHLGLRVQLENDARMALLGEWYAGSAQGADSVVMLTLGTGIGGAVLINGKPLRTGQPQAGCLGGHIPVKINGRRCSCGALGCMEAEASSWALPMILEEWPGVEDSLMADNLHGGFKRLFACADAGDATAIAVRDHCIQVWAAGTVGLVHAYGPELVLFGGGVMRAGDLIIERVRQYVTQYAWQPGKPVRIEKAGLGPDAALYGTIPLLEERANQR